MVPRLFAPRFKGGIGVFLLRGSEFLNIFLEYIIVFIGVYCLNYFVSVQGQKLEKKKKKMTEALYLKKFYGVVISKKDYSKFLVICSLINTFIISTIYIIIMYLVSGIIFKVIIGVILLVLMIIICYGLLAKYYLWKEGK